MVPKDKPLEVVPGPEGEQGQSEMSAPGKTAGEAEGTRKTVDEALARQGAQASRSPAPNNVRPIRGKAHGKKKAA